MELRELTCIVCPLGCSIKVELENNEVVSVTGNSCPRGEKYAKKECTNPERTVTTTMRTSNGGVVPVKTDKPIPKDKMFDAMKLIKGKIVVLPVSIGDVVIENVFGSNIVAVKNQADAAEDK